MDNNYKDVSQASEEAEQKLLMTLILPLCVTWEEKKGVVITGSESVCKYVLLASMDNTHL